MLAKDGYNLMSLLNQEKLKRVAIRFGLNPRANKSGGQLMHTRVLCQLIKQLPKKDWFQVDVSVLSEAPARNFLLLCD